MDNVPDAIQHLLHRATFNKPLGKNITFQFLRSVIASDLNVPARNVRFVRPAIRQTEPDKHDDNNRTNNTDNNENENAGHVKDDCYNNYSSLANMQLPMNVYVVEVCNVVQDNKLINKQVENKPGNSANANEPF